AAEIEQAIRQNAGLIAEKIMEMPAGAESEDDGDADDMEASA
ncbi:MAG: DNA recombination/repair protein RecA, partial [Alphaproteobacteria bacterium HGW-Alphaproteobacteria-12]